MVDLLGESRLGWMGTQWRWWWEERSWIRTRCMVLLDGREVWENGGGAGGEESKAEYGYGAWCCWTEKRWMGWVGKW